MAQINFLSTPSCVVFLVLGLFCARFSSNNSEFLNWFFWVFIDIIEDDIGSEFFNTSS